MSAQLASFITRSVPSKRYLPDAEIGDPSASLHMTEWPPVSPSTWQGNLSSTLSSHLLYINPWIQVVDILDILISGIAMDYRISFGITENLVFYGSMKIEINIILFAIWIFFSSFWNLTTRFATKIFIYVLTILYGCIKNEGFLCPWPLKLRDKKYFCFLYLFHT